MLNRQDVNPKKKGMHYAACRRGLDFFDFEILFFFNTKPLMFADGPVIPAGMIHNLLCKAEGFFHIRKKLSDRADIFTILQDAEHMINPPLRLDNHKRQTVLSPRSWRGSGGAERRSATELIKLRKHEMKQFEQDHEELQLTDINYNFYANIFQILIFILFSIIYTNLYSITQRSCDNFCHLY